MRKNGLQLLKSIPMASLSLIALVLLPVAVSAQVNIHSAESYPMASPAAPPPPPAHWNILRVAPRPAPVVAPEDPASTRLTLFNTADTLRQGEWSLTWREFATLEIGVGLSDWLEINFRTSPILIVVPDGGAVNSLWAGGVRLRMLKTQHFTLTTELEGASFLGYAGLRGGVAAKIGSDRFALHLGLSGLWLWQASDDSWLDPQVDYEDIPRCANNDCGTVSVPSDDTPSIAAVLPNAGLTIRLHRRVKLLAEAVYISAAKTMLMTPSLRLHGQSFACDLGMMVIYDIEEQGGWVVPVVNMSVRF